MSHVRSSEILCTTLISSVDTLNYVHSYLACLNPSVTVILKASPHFMYTARMKTAMRVWSWEALA